MSTGSSYISFINGLPMIVKFILNLFGIGIVLYGIYRIFKGKIIVGIIWIFTGFFIIGWIIDFVTILTKNKIEFLA